MFAVAALSYGATAAAATSAEEFERIRLYLRGEWTKWTNMCAHRDVPIKDDKDFEMLDERLATTQGCLRYVVNEVRGRTNPEPLVNPSIWRGFSSGQQQALVEELAAANSTVIELVNKTSAAQADAVKARLAEFREREVARILTAAPAQDSSSSDGSMLTEDEIRSCAQRYVGLRQDYLAIDGLKSDIRQTKLEHDRVAAKLARITHKDPGFDELAVAFSAASAKRDRLTKQVDTQSMAFFSAVTQYKTTCASRPVARKARDAVCADKQFLPYCEPPAVLAADEPAVRGELDPDWLSVVFGDKKWDSPFRDIHFPYTCYRVRSAGTAYEASTPRSCNSAEVRYRLQVDFESGESSTSSWTDLPSNGVVHVADFLESLTSRPSLLTIEIEQVVSTGKGARLTQVVRHANWASMDLNTDNWLSMQVFTDLMMKRITTALAARRYKEALPSFRKLAQRSKELPESFDYYFIDALANADEKAEARRQTDAYLSKYGNRGKYYDKVIELRGQLNQRQQP